MEIVQNYWDPDKQSVLNFIEDRRRRSSAFLTSQLAAAALQNIQNEDDAEKQHMTAEERINQIYQSNYWKKKVDSLLKQKRKSIKDSQKFHQELILSQRQNLELQAAIKKRDSLIEQLGGGLHTLTEEQQYQATHRDSMAAQHPESEEQSEIDTVDNDVDQIKEVEDSSQYSSVYQQNEKFIQEVIFKKLNLSELPLQENQTPLSDSMFSKQIKNKDMPLKIHSHTTSINKEITGASKDNSYSLVNTSNLDVSQGGYSAKGIKSFKSRNNRNNVNGLRKYMFTTAEASQVTSPGAEGRSRQMPLTDRKYPKHDMSYDITPRKDINSSFTQMNSSYSKLSQQKKKILSSLKIGNKSDLKKNPKKAVKRRTQGSPAPMSISVAAK